MKLKVSTLVISVFLLTAIVLGWLIFKNVNLKSKSTPFNYQTKTVIIKDKRIKAEVADSVPKQALGLGKRTSLDENSGMLFPYSKKTVPYFWMKGMFIHIDIIWIADNKIVKIDKNVPNLPLNTPDSELPTYYPHVPVNLVLEVNSGFSDKNNFSLGDEVRIE